MSLKDAVAQATRETLNHYLAPDLVDQLTDEILHRVGPEAENALQDFLGFGALRPQGPRTKTASMKGKKRKERPSTLDDGAPRPVSARGGDDSENVPSPSEMS